MIPASVQGERVASLRARLGLSQRAFAAAAGVSQATLHRVETGVRRARMDELVRIARAGGAPLDELIEETPFSAHVLVGARANRADANTAAVKARLVTMLRMDAHLEAAGIARPA